MFQHVGCSVPITAVAFAGPLLLCGEGGTVKAYNPADQCLITSLDVFGSTSIHGIECRELQNRHFKVLVWGAALTALLDLRIAGGISGKAELSLASEPTVCPDWILEARLRDDLGTVVLITAHNALLFLELVDGRPSLKVATAQSRSILYSAALSWEADGSVLVASGTVFGQIIVWTATFVGEKLETTLHKVFTGHEGSPFGLYIEPPLRQGSSQTPRFLASCSDDRTVRLWDMGNLSTIAVDPHAAIDYASLVGSSSDHTGYNDTSSALTDAGSGCFASAMGHLSRIWGVHAFRDTHDSDNLYVTTFGEDAACHIWGYEPSKATARGSVPMRHIRHLDCHAGKNIWAHAVRRVDSQAVLIATGGADGSISLQIYTPPGTSGAAAGSSPKKLASQANKIRSYAFLTDKSLIVTNNAGDVYTVEVGSERSVVIDDVQSARDTFMVCHELDVAGFCMASSVPTMSLAFLAGKSGSVYAYRRESGLTQLLPGRRKTAGIFSTLLTRPAEAKPAAACLISWQGDPVAALLFLRDEDATSDEVFLLRLPDGEIVTSFCLLALETDSELVVIGCRSGLAAYYRLPKADKSSTENKESIAPLMTVHHHADAVADMLAILRGETNLIYSSCRDGSYSVALLKQSVNEVDIELVHHLPVPGLSEAHRVFEDKGRILIAGFRRKHFVIWDVGTERELVAVECGGSNRMWAYDPSGVLAWTQASALHVERPGPSSQIRINAGSHGREIKAMALSGHDWLDGAIMATGSEDTDIKLSRAVVSGDAKLELRCERTLRKHNTGIQSLRWTEDSRRLISSGGMEELFVWRVMEVPDLGLGVRCESMCPFTSAIPDLRMTDVAVRNGDANSVVLAVCRSDSSVHVYKYHPSKPDGPTWSRLSIGTYLTCALTNVAWLSDDAVLTTATDGHAAIFRIGNDAEMQWDERFKMHQSASQCAEIVSWNGKDRIVVSGGDDGSLSLSLLAGSGIATATIARAHAAAVTGLGVVRKSSSKLWLVSVALDQKVKVWEVTPRGAAEGISVAKVQAIDSSVADAGALSVGWDGSAAWLAVAGVGWEGWRMDGTTRGSA